MLNIYETVTNQKRKSAVIIVIFTVFVLIATYFLSSAFSYYLYGYYDGLFATGFALILTGLTSFGSYYYSDKIIAGISGARRADPKEFKLFHQVVENLCLGSQLPKPQLYIIDDTAMNAFAAGRDPNHCLVCSTTGLLQALNRSELEAVFAHELSHIKNYDTRLMSLASVMVGSLTLLADWLLRLGFHGRDRKNRGEAGAIIMLFGVIAAILAPLIGQLLQLAISRSREFMADAGSVKITHNPEALASALSKIDQDVEKLEAANKSTAHLYFANPFHEDSTHKSNITRPGIDWFSSLFNTHPSIQERLKLLSQMS